MPTRGGSHLQERDIAVLTSVRTLYRRDWSLDTGDRRGHALAKSEELCIPLALFKHKPLSGH